MAKIKLTKVLREGLEQEKKKQESLHKMSFYEKKMDQGLEKLRNLMRRDGYNV
jgi:hypothetical protein